jgi:peptide/nickel transport system substrate-binding protein
LGLNDFQVMDWGTMIAHRDPLEQGGWNLFCVTWAGLTVSGRRPLRGTGRRHRLADDKLEARLKWLDTNDLATQQSCPADAGAGLCQPAVPLGQWLAAAYSDKLTGDPLAVHAVLER